MVLLLEKASQADSVVFLGKMPFISTPVGERGGLLAMNKPIVTTEGLRTIVGSCCRNKDKLWWLSSATSICRLNCLKMPASSIISLFFSERLQELKEKEKEADFFTKMPSKHYMEVASLLLNRYVLIKHGKMV